MKKTFRSCRRLRAWGITLITLSFFSITTNVSGQNEIDVLRYSRLNRAGSIRTMGMGGAFGSLGADIGSIGINPAGIGMYRRGDASFSAGIHSSGTKSTLGGASNIETDISGSLGAIGVVITTPSVNPDWPFVTMGVTHVKQAIYDQRLLLENANLNGSLLGVFQGLAQGTHNADLNDGIAFPYTASLAWYTYLLDPDGESNVDYITPFNTDTAVTLNRRIERSGNIGDTQYSMGGTFRDWLSIGATISTSKVTFSEESRHEEIPTEEGTDLASWTYVENLDVQGSGISAKLGAIAKVTDWLRVGLAWHSPSRLKLTDSYSTSMRSVWKDGDLYEESSPDGAYEYLIITPSRFIVSGSFVLGKYAIISTDYESVDYSRGKLKSIDGWMSTGYSFETENQTVNDIYRRGHEARVGLEVRVAKDFRLRVGTGISTSPYSHQSGVLSDPSQFNASLGGEYRNERWYAGFAWNRTWYSEDLYLIDPLLQGSPLQVDRSLGMLSIGAGFRI
ncbi:MAG: hypothetical protein COA49_06915 [Bacteroidetes bacterium]|nr:MAG: hypothetical protein COA49_06915 [Bacteroidota bacterium]